MYRISQTKQTNRLIIEVKFISRGDQQMTKEHIVHFKIIRKDATSQLRGLIYVDENTEPTVQDYEQCLRNCGHNVTIENPQQFIFKAFDPATGKEYLIDVLENFGRPARDGQVESLARSFMKNTPNF